MPSSSGEGKLLFREWMTVFKPATILDVGVGAGIYGMIAREVSPESHLTALEVYEPYVETYKLKEKYNKVVVEDVRTFCLHMDNYDLIIFGDVLEHLPKEVAIWVWKEMKVHAKFLWLSLPIKVVGRAWSLGYYNQSPHEYAVNSQEKHLYDWEYDEVLIELGPFLWAAPYKTVGSFCAEGSLK